MEAKNTVMNLEQMNQAVLNNPNLPMGQAIAQAQAEISFSLGEKKGVEKDRQEVVEFIEKGRNACRLNKEQFECRLCLSELLEALNGKPNSRSGG